MENAEKETTQYMTKIAGDETKGYRLQLFSKKLDKMIDISTLVGDITHSTSMLDNAGQLTFFVQKDPSGIVGSINNGDLVLFKKDGVGIFYGYVFTVGMDATEVFKITAFDQMRYLKNENVMVIKNMTVSEIFKKICVENKLKYKIITPIDYVPPAKIYEGKTMFSILREVIQLAENDSAKKAKENKGVAQKYIIRDNFGTLELRSVESLMTNVKLGDESLLSSYQYETSIDKNTYNSIIVVQKVNVEGKKKKGEKKEKNTFIKEQKSDSLQKTWGLLRKVVQADEHMNEAQVIEFAQNWLKNTGRETRTLSLSSMGVMGFTAGVGFKFDVSSLGQQLFMYILNATHKYQQDFHTMELEVNANDLEVYYK